MSARKTCQSDRRGVWSALALVVQYPFIVLALLLSYLVFRVLNRTTVIGRRFARFSPRTVVVSNHQSLIDSFLVGSVLGIPQLFFQPRLTPWQLADAKNFPLLYWLLQVIQVNRDQSDLTAFFAASKVLTSGGTVHVFPESTRSTDDELRPIKRAAAALILNAAAGLQVVYFTGMHQVQPYRKRPGDGRPTWLRLFGKKAEWHLHFRTGQRLTVNVGRHIPPAEVAAMAGNGSLRERSEQLAKVIVQELRSLQEETMSVRSAL